MMLTMYEAWQRYSSGRVQKPAWPGLLGPAAHLWETTDFQNLSSSPTSP
jgi:hypothetical protein